MSEKQPLQHLVRPQAALCQSALTRSGRRAGLRCGVSSKADIDSGTRADLADVKRPLVADFVAKVVEKPDEA